MDENIKEILDEIVTAPKESEWIEFKVNNSNPDQIGEYISALSNSACLLNLQFGYIVFGVDDKTHEIVGTDFDPHTTKKGNEEIENWLSINLKPRVDFNIFFEEIDGRRVVIFKIDSTINTPVAFKGIEYIRVGSYKKKLKDHPEKARKIWNKLKSFEFEKGNALSKLTKNEILEKIDYESCFRLLNIPKSDSNDSIIAKLVEEKIINHQSGKYNISNLGAILFSKRIEDFESISRKAIRVIIYKGNDRLVTINEMVNSNGYAVGFEDLIDFINNTLPGNEVIVNALREYVPQYPSVAIRELVANAIIHQDLSIKGTSPLIEIFSNRVEITNPGKPIIDTLRFIDHSPESRNEKLAKIMRRMNICEERGSGIDRVIVSCETHQLPAPEFIMGDSYTRVILRSPREFKAMDKKDKIRACYQHCCLKYVTGEQMTNESLRQRFGIETKNYPMASRIISDTIEHELIKNYEINQSRKYAKYVPFWA